MRLGEGAGWSAGEQQGRRDQTYDGDQPDATARPDKVNHSGQLHKGPRQPCRRPASALRPVEASESRPVLALASSPHREVALASQWVFHDSLQPDLYFHQKE